MEDALARRLTMDEYDKYRGVSAEFLDSMDVLTKQWNDRQRDELQQTMGSLCFAYDAAEIPEESRKRPAPSAS